MNNKGYIRLYRKILDNPVVNKDNDHLSVFIYLLLTANHSEKKVIFNGNQITLKPGQLVTGRKNIAECCHVSESKVERILSKLESEQQIEQQKSTKKRVISVLNWGIYQKSEQQSEQQTNDEWTTKFGKSEQQKNSTKPLFIGACEEIPLKSEQQKLLKVNNKRTTKLSKSEQQNLLKKCLFIGPREEQCSKSEQQKLTKVNTNNNEYNSYYYCYLENNYARAISSIEIEVLDDLLKLYDAGLVKEAIKQSVIMNRKNLNYVKGILRNWKSEGVKTKKDLEKVEEKEEPIEIFDYDWLNDSNEY